MRGRGYGLPQGKEKGSNEMSHECPMCGQECYCDGEDHGQPAPDDCSHECDGADYFGEEDDEVVGRDP